MPKKKKLKNPTRRSINLGVGRTQRINKAMEQNAAKTEHGFMLDAIDEKLNRLKIK